MSVAVSVIVPIFKTPPKYLEACLDSLTTQTLQETEFILVFDGPNERLFKVCKSQPEDSSVPSLWIYRYIAFNAETDKVKSARKSE